jgi:Uma2 family endonuclease
MIMAIENLPKAWPPYPVEPWPPDDTEESVLGTDLHQTTITNLRLGINQAARVGKKRGEPGAWRAFTQITLIGCRRPDGSSYRTLPDVFVYGLATDENRGSISIVSEGPPLLIVEVLSESTYDTDIDLVRGKGYSYARAGVPEYMVLDVAGQFLKERLIGWRLVEGAYRRWEPDDDGRLHSAQLHLAFHLEGVLAVVSLPDGRRMLHEDDVEEELARRDEELARKDEELARLRRLLGESL